MTAKAEYIPNGYVCNKCGSRMDAIITPPLSTLGKIKLVCNNCNKHMTKNWQERFDEMSEIEEFWGLPYDHLVDEAVKNFISDIIDQTRDQTREETIREVEDMVNKIILKDLTGKWSNDVVDFSTSIVNATVSKMKQSLKSLINK